MANNNTDLEQTIAKQADLIRQLKQAIGRLEQKMVMMDKKASRTADNVRRAGIDINNIKQVLGNRQ